MLEKYFDIGGYTDSEWDSRQILLHGPMMDKVASDNYTPDALMRVAETLQPRDDGVYVLLNALGADEYWGGNRNGDVFPEWSLKGEPAPADVAAILAKRLPERGLTWSQPPTDAYGTKTFEDHAHVYQFHQNRDPRKRIGDVIAAAYNDKMHRSELIVFIMRDRDPMTVRQIEQGEPVPFSMGAKLPFDCLPEGAPIASAKGITSVQDVQIGDLVWTHKGRLRPVTTLFKRNYSGSIHTIKVGGLPTPLECTPNHPVYVFRKEILRDCRGTAGAEKRRHTYVDGVCRICQSPESELTPDFVTADSVKVGDYVAVPKANCSSTEVITEDMARLLGYYLGDGHVICDRSRKTGKRVYNGLAFTCGSHETEHIQRIHETLAMLSDGPVREYSAGEGRNAISVQVRDAHLTARVVSLCGMTKKKHIPVEIFAQPIESRLALLAGLVDTDGHVDYKQCKARVTITLPGIQRPAQMLAVSCGLPATMSKGAISGGYGCSEGYQFVYQLNLGSIGAQALREYSVKCAKLPENTGRWSNLAVMLKDYMLLPVKSISEREVETTVYNFEVAEDNSYIAHGLSVHNCCLACNNIARTRAQYCDHLKSMLRRVLPDGKRCLAANLFPRFFDISRVRRPADQGAWSLRKVAEEGYTEKTATMIKRTAPAAAEEVKPTTHNPKTLAFIKERLKDDIQSQKKLPRKTMGMLKKAGLKAAVEHCAALGIVLRNSEMRELMGPEKLAEADGVNFNSLNRDLLHELEPLLAERSMFEPFFTKRAAAKKKKVPYKPPSASDEDNLFAELFDVPTMNKLASAVDNDMSIRFSLESDVFTRVFTPSEPNPKWLPFVIATYNK